MTREEQKAYNAENYPASVLTWLSEATDRAFDDFKSRTCLSCKYYNDFNESSGLCENIKITFIDAVDNDFGCNKWKQRQ